MRGSQLATSLYGQWGTPSWALERPEARYPDVPGRGVGSTKGPTRRGWGSPPVQRDGVGWCLGRANRGRRVVRLLQTSSEAALGPLGWQRWESLGGKNPPPPPAHLRFVGRRAEVPSRRWGKGMRRAPLTSISPPDVSKSYTIVLVSIFSHIHPPPGLGAFCSGPPNPGGRGEAGGGGAPDPGPSSFFSTQVPTSLPWLPPTPRPPVPGMAASSLRAVRGERPLSPGPVADCTVGPGSGGQASAGPSPTS